MCHQGVLHHKGSSGVLPDLSTVPQQDRSWVLDTTMCITWTHVELPSFQRLALGYPIPNPILAEEVVLKVGLTYSIRKARHRCRFVDLCGTSHMP